MLMKKFFLSLLLLMLVIPVAVADNITSSTWTKVTSSDDFDPAARYVLVTTEVSKAYYISSYSHSGSSGYLYKCDTAVTVTDNVISSIPSDAGIFEFEATSTEGSYNMKVSDYDGALKGYYNATAAKKSNLTTSASDNSVCTLTFAESATTITFGSYGSIYYNSGSPRFLNYTSSQTAVFLYKESRMETAAVTMAAAEPLPTLEVGAAPVSFEKFVTITVDGDESGDKAAALLKMVTLSLADEYAEYAQLDAEARTVTALAPADEIKLVASLAASAEQNTEAAEDVEILLPVKALEQLTATISCEEEYEICYGDSATPVPFTIEPEEAAEYVVVEGSESLSVEKVDGVWMMTPVKVASTGVTISLPADGKYVGNSVWLKVYVYPAKVVTTPAADDSNVINAYVGKAVTFVSKGAERLDITLDGGAETSVDGETYSVTFDAEGDHTIVVKTVFADENGSYSRTYSYDIHVGGAIPTGSYTFDFTKNSYGMTTYTGNSQNYNPSPVTVKSDDEAATFEVTVTNGDNGKNRHWQTTDGYQWRFTATKSKDSCYTIKVKQTGDVTLTQIDFVGAMAKGTSSVTPTFTADCGNVATTDNGVTWTGEAQEVTFELKETNSSTSNATLSLDSLGISFEGYVKGVTDEVRNIQVEEVEGAPVYYNLQGQRVANPTRGIYIRVVGNRATKVML
jgi:hypothetical protein